MVSHHRQPHPVTRQSRGINRRRDTIPNVLTRIRVLTPAEINQRLLENWDFIQIETVQQIRNPPPPPLAIIPNIINGPGLPVPELIEFPLRNEEYILPDQTNIQTTTDSPSTSVENNNPPILNIPEEPINLFEDFDEQETILLDQNIGTNQLSNIEDLGDLYEPVAEQSQEPTTQLTEEPSLSQLLREILSETDYELAQL